VLDAFVRWLTGAPARPEGELADIFVAADAGQPMRRLTEARALPGAGLEGDRYATGRGYWRRTDGCEVTLVDAVDLERAERRSGIAFADGEHRRNLVVRGIPLHAFRGHEVQIGEVRLAFQRLRPPCGYLDQVLRPGAGKALGRGAGICLRVVRGGVLRVGESVRLLEPGTGG
jgi:MOSC domain-containing protein YiiM